MKGAIKGALWGAAYVAASAAGIKVLIWLEGLFGFDAVMIGIGVGLSAFVIVAGAAVGWNREPRS